MKLHEKARSAAKPEPLKVDEFSVWVNTNIKTVKEDGEYGFIGFEFDIFQYDKDEYIKIMDNQLTDTQLALCEIYERMV